MPLDQEAKMEDPQIADTILANRCFGWCIHCPQTSPLLGWAEQHHAATGHTTMQRESATRRFGALP